VADVRAFRALRYDERVAGPLSKLICPPYDVISSETKAALEARDPRNFVRVELPRADPAGYSTAAALLHDWRTEGALTRDLPTALYVHDHTFTIGGARATRRGVFVALRLHPLEEGVVLPHEHTFPKAKADRLELMRATRANTSPVFGLSEIGGAVSALMPFAHEIARTTVDEDEHRLAWVTNPDVVAAFAAALRDARVYIADGHHRYETALAYADGTSKDAPERFTLVSLTALDDPGVRILATHRLVRGHRAALEKAVAASFEASSVDAGALGDMQPGIVLARDGRFTRIEPKPSADRSRMPDAWRELPVALAEELLLKTARDAGAEIAYEHDGERAIALARGNMTAVLLRPISPATLRSVSDAGERLPQKTTYFYPKVPAGLVIRTLEED
jgi:uncharacterized protein (DUF1015 family)